MKISQGTIARTIVLALALVNQILATAGKGTINIAENDIYQFISVGCTIAASAAAWWKNNSFTREAILADENLKNMREEVKNGSVE